MKQTLWIFLLLATLLLGLRFLSSPPDAPPPPGLTLPPLADPETLRTFAALSPYAAQPEWLPAIDAIKLSGPTGETHLHREGPHWSLRAPWQAPAVTPLVQNLLNAFRAGFPSLPPQPLTAAEQAAMGLSPETRGHLLFEKDGQSWGGYDLWIGAPVADPSGRPSTWVSPVSDPRYAYLIPDVDLQQLALQGPGHFRDRNLFEPAHFALERLVITPPDSPPFTILPPDPSAAHPPDLAPWRLEAPDPQRLDDQAAATFKLLGHLQADTFTSDTAPLTPPYWQLDIVHNGQRSTLHIGAAEGDLHPAYRAEDSLRFSLKNREIAALLQHPESLSDRRLAPFLRPLLSPTQPNDVAPGGAHELTAPLSHLSLLSPDAPWEIASRQGRHLFISPPDKGQADLKSWLSDLHKIRVRRWATPAETAALSTQSPLTELHLQGPAPDHPELRLSHLPPPPDAPLPASPAPTADTGAPFWLGITSQGTTHYALVGHTYHATLFPDAADLTWRHLHAQRIFRVDRATLDTPSGPLHITRQDESDFVSEPPLPQPQLRAIAQSLSRLQANLSRPRPSPLHPTPPSPYRLKLEGPDGPPARFTLLPPDTGHPWRLQPHQGPLKGLPLTLTPTDQEALEAWLRALPLGP